MSDLLYYQKKHALVLLSAFYLVTEGLLKGHAPGFLYHKCSFKRANMGILLVAEYNKSDYTLTKISVKVIIKYWGGIGEGQH